MLSEYVAAKDHDGNASHDGTTAAARNKRKMTRPKRMLPPPSAPSNHRKDEDEDFEDDQVGVVLDEEQQHSNGPWNLGDLIGVGFTGGGHTTTPGQQPLDLRSSADPCDDVIVGMVTSLHSDDDSHTESGSVEMNEAMHGRGGVGVGGGRGGGGRNYATSATELNGDSVSTEAGYLCDPGVAMDTGSSSGHGVAMETTTSGDVIVRMASGGSKGYKHMTRQRRIEANARERSRVHTISAAFESLRRAVPSYAYNQRLSKLAILRIACSYIVALASLADLDYSQTTQDDGGAGVGAAMDFGECVDLCTRTIQAEGRAKRRQ